MAKLLKAARLAASALLAFLIVAHPGESRADVWNWLTGLIESDPEAAALSGQELPPDTIVTKDGETRVLQLGRDILELHPSTAVTIEESGPNTSVRLITGTVRVQAAKRKKGHTFNVRTLMLVATVKGTEFEVSATRKGSAVSVYEGRVAVKATGRVGGIDVTPGKTATVTNAEEAPRLGATPPGGAPAALGRPSKSVAASGDDSDDDDDGGRENNRDVKSTSRGASGAGSGSGGGSDNDGEGGESGGDDNGGDDGEGGENGEGGEGGDDGDDD